MLISKDIAWKKEQKCLVVATVSEFKGHNSNVETGKY